MNKKLGLRNILYNETKSSFKFLLHTVLLNLYVSDATAVSKALLPVDLQGCASWKWYFPFHYAPFASDFKDIKEMFTEFEKDTMPVRKHSIIQIFMWLILTGFS